MAHLARLRAPGTITLAVALLTACSKPEAARPPAEPPRAITALAYQGTLTVRRELGGFLSPEQNVLVASTLNAAAGRVPVREGEYVRAGTVLVRFEVADLQAQYDAALQAAAQAHANAVRQRYAAAQALSGGRTDVDTAAAALAQAREKLRLDDANVARQSALLRQGFVSQQAYDSAMQIAQSDAAAVRSATAALSNARTVSAVNGSASSGLQGASIRAADGAAAQADAQARQIATQLRRAIVVAPIGGVIVNRNINPGEYPGSRTLFTLQAIDTMYATLTASSTELRGVKIGSPVSVRAAGEPRVYPGRVAAILGQAIPGSTNFTVKVALANPGRRLLVGTAVTGSIVLPPAEGVIVPRMALTSPRTVSVVRGDRVHLVPVAVLAEDERVASIRGIVPGARVVTSPINLSEGERVAVR